jgi:hypothetical protein
MEWIKCAEGLGIVEKKVYNPNRATTLLNGGSVPTILSDKELPVNIPA